MFNPRIHRVPLLKRGLTRQTADAKFVWILGHMRSGSTLLAHIFMNHPRVQGFGESWVRYEDPSDFVELFARVRLYIWLERIFYPQAKQPVNPRFVLDKILHDKLVPDPRVINSPRLKVVFLLREPQSIVSSLLGAPIPFPHAKTPETATAYCVRRFRSLTKCAESLSDPTHAVVLHYEALTCQSSASLRALQEFLGLAEPFSETYGKRLATGVPGLGDPTRLIKSGRIERGHAPKRMKLSKDLGSALTAAYRECRDTMVKLGIAEIGAPASVPEATRQ